MDNPDRRRVLQGVAAGAAIATWGSSALADAHATGEYFVIAEAVAQPDKADALRDLLVPLAALSSAEPGCLEYKLMEVQGEPGRFLTFERWKDKAAADVHMMTPDIAALVPKLGEVLAKPFTQIFMGDPETV